MSHCDLQQNALVAWEEMKGPAFASVTKDPVVCPTPRRVGILHNRMMRPSRLQISPHGDGCDSKAGAELLDIILKKEGYGAEQFTNQVASPPPFFCGSPPSRATNPLIQNAQFGDEKVAPIPAMPFASPLGVTSPPSSARKGGCVRMNFGLKPAAVRVEGFDCLNRDCQNSSIPAMA